MTAESRRYRIEFRPRARRDFLSLPRSVQRRIGRKVLALRDEPHPATAKKLRGPEGFLRLRVGDYRVIYLVDGDRVVVVVTRIGHRREVYR